MNFSKSLMLRASPRDQLKTLSNFPNLAILYNKTLSRKVDYSKRLCEIVFSIFKLVKSHKRDQGPIYHAAPVDGDTFRRMGGAHEMACQLASYLVPSKYKYGEQTERMETCHVYTEYKHAYNIFLAKAWRIITTLSILNSNYKIF